MSISQRQLDEIEALSYVLEEGCLIRSNITQQPYKIEMLITSTPLSTTSPTSIQVTLPESYPVSEAPILDIKSDTITAKQIQQIQNHLNSTLFKPDEEVLYQLYSYIKDEIVAHIDSGNDDNVEDDATNKVAKGEVDSCEAAISNLDFAVKDAHSSSSTEHTQQQQQRQHQHQSVVENNTNKQTPPKKAPFQKEDFFWSADYHSIFKTRKFEYPTRNYKNGTNGQDAESQLSEDDLLWKLHTQFQAFSISSSIDTNPTTNEGQTSSKDSKKTHQHLNSSIIDYTAYCFPLFTNIDHFYSNSKRTFLYDQFKMLKEEKEEQIATLLASASSSSSSSTVNTKIEQLSNEINAMSDPMAQIVEILTCLYALDEIDRKKRDDWTIKSRFVFYFQYTDEVEAVVTNNNNKLSQKHAGKQQHQQQCTHQKTDKKHEKKGDKKHPQDEVVVKQTGMVFDWDEGTEDGFGEVLKGAAELFQKSDFLIIYVLKYEDAYCECQEAAGRRVRDPTMFHQITVDLLKKAKFPYKEAYKG